MSKLYACYGCTQVWQADELITVTNPEWRMKPMDDECCPECQNLCTEVQD